jgi:hypothetical protein
MWRSILHCRELGAVSVSLGRTDLPQEGLRRFKLGWGAHEREIHYYQYNLADGRWLTERNLRFGWHNRVFSGIPMWASRLAGELLYPHLD